MECPHCFSQIRSQAKRCKRCGGAIPSGQYLLEEAGVVERAPASTSLSSSDADRNPARYRFARLGDRLIAFVLDTAVLFGLFTVVDAWIFMHFCTFDGGELQLTTACLLIALTLNAAILFLYGWLLEAAFGATLGKAIVGIRVVATGRRSFLSACALRNVFRIVDGLGFYLVGAVVAACSNLRQRIGDVLAQTAVIEESFGGGIRMVAFALWIAILAGAGWLVPRICLANHPIPSRYLSQVVVRVGETAESAYVRFAGLSVDVRSTTSR
jgi:uncharacterized RDD family membrane protein YckC